MRYVKVFFIVSILLLSLSNSTVDAGAFDQLLQMSGGSAPSVPTPSEPSYSYSNENPNNSWEAQEYRRQLRAEKAQRRRERKEREKKQREKQRSQRSYRGSSPDDENKVSVSPTSSLKPEEKKDFYQWPKGLPGKRYTSSPARKSSSTLKSPVKTVIPGQEAKVLAETNLSIKILRKKKNLSNEEKKLLAELEDYSRTIWLKTVNQEKVSKAERLKSQVPLPVENSDPAKSMAILTLSSINSARQSSVSQAAGNYDPTVDAFSKFHASKSQQLAEFLGKEQAEAIMPEQGKEIYGNMLSVGKVSIKLAGKKYAEAGAQVIDVVVSRIGIPQAQFAVEGGRIYSDVTFKALDSFMVQSMQAVGGKFDRKEFWKNLKKEMNQPQQAFFEWIGGHE